MNYAQQLLISEQIKLESYLKDNHYKCDVPEIRAKINEIKGVLLQLGTPGAKPIVWNDNHYQSLEERARDTLNSPQNLRYYLKKGIPFQGHCIDYLILNQN